MNPLSPSPSSVPTNAPTAQATEAARSISPDIGNPMFHYEDQLNMNALEIDRITSLPLLLAVVEAAEKVGKIATLANLGALQQSVAAYRAAAGTKERKTK